MASLKSAIKELKCWVLIHIRKCKNQILRIEIIIPIAKHLLKKVEHGFY